MPLLKLFKERDGDWVIDKELLGRIVRTLRDTERPAIVYLFSTHFGQNAPIEEALAADPANLSWTPAGPLPKDTYYGTAIYNWSVANTRTAITRPTNPGRRRRDPGDLQAGAAADRKDQGRHAAGRSAPAVSPTSSRAWASRRPISCRTTARFRRSVFAMFLAELFRHHRALNARFGSSWSSFDQVEPPSKDVRTTPLRDVTEHIDSFAHGSLPISGWAHATGATDLEPAMVRIYLNGDLIGRVPANLGRQDVLAALPELGTANTGWRYDIDFRELPTGLHRIDVFLENRPDDLVHLSTRNIAILDKGQQTPSPLPQKKLPASRKPDASVKASVDLPADQSSYFHNPLATLWHLFRAMQVARYLQWFNQSVKPDCLARTRRYTHQIIPFTNPGWDETKFAIDASLQPRRHRPGCQPVW